jgi:hypothetical protein
VVSVLGSVRFRRGYYYCRLCGQGKAPFDEATGLGPHRVTPGAERIASLLGVTCDGFEEAAEKVLPEACGLRLGESTVQRVTEDAGARLGQWHQEQRTLGDSKPFTWHKDATGRTCAYVSLDLTGVRQQAKDGGTAEGRMPYVAAIYNPAPEKNKPAKAEQTRASTSDRASAERAAFADGAPDAAPPSPRPRMQARYLSGLLTLDELGVLLRQQAAQVGMEQAEQWIGLSDGGSGLENFLQSNFNRPNLVLILDFWHPASYLEALARAWHSDDEEKRQALAQAWCHALKHQGGQAMVEVLKGLQLPKSKAVQTTYEEALQYIANNVHRMDYPAYLAKGWQIGSGPIESACKTVVGQRLKQAGMRWREYGTDNVCHLRALFKSEKHQWDAFWERHVNARSISYPQK